MEKANRLNMTVGELLHGRGTPLTATELLYQRAMYAIDPLWDSRSEYQLAQLAFFYQRQHSKNPNSLKLDDYLLRPKVQSDEFDKGELISFLDKRVKK